ncbi:MAG: diaminobutyrate--2-oxoglutarate transaminase [Myxococcota bacterium]
MEVFEQLESEVRGYCRSFPTVFSSARGARLTDEGGRSYVDFFSGAGALNYGHNDPAMKRALLRYLEDDGIVHSLDMATTAKAEFLEALESFVLAPRNLDYRIQFPGPTGTNSVEAALKLARKVTGRETIVSFTNAFHGMTLGSLAITGNGFKRRGAGVPLTLGDTMPFDGYLGEDVDTLDYFEALLADDGSGVDKPAAVMLETVQAEGGINVAGVDWLRRLERLCRDHDILLIVDDIQVGCGRTGPFFSFERAGIAPDLVCLSKSLSGYGLPLAILLIRPDLDIWEPGEHNGTFRGHNPAFVTARVALEEYWSGDALSHLVAQNGETVRARLETIAQSREHDDIAVRGVGLIQGLAFDDPEVSSRVCAAAFERGLIMETAGPEGHVAKVMPPLTIDEIALKEGLEILESAVRAVAAPAPAGVAGEVAAR